MDFKKLYLFRFLNRKIYTTRKFWGSLIAIPLLIAAIVFVSQLVGGFQLLEWRLLDRFFQWRSPEGIDSRIVVVTYGEEDIAKIGKWPFSDAVVADLITKIESGQPRVLGLDIYRNLPVEPGSSSLKRIFQSTPNLVGVEKYVSPSVAPPPDLNYADQVGFVDVVVDLDGTVRRGVLSIEKTDGNVIYSFATKIALKYLGAEGIAPQPDPQNPYRIDLGKTRITPFEPSQGGYAGADAGGYQILLNYRCLSDCFQQVSITDVLAGKYDKDLFRDRIVLVGATAESLRDFFFSPYGKIPGVFIHANLISQIVKGALEQRPFLKTYPKWMEGVWVFSWAFVGVIGIWSFLKDTRFSKAKFIIGIITFLASSILVLLGLAYISFLFSFWLPIIPALCSFFVSSLICIIYLSEQLRYVSNIDELTQIANRRYFDRFLMQNFRKRKDLSVVLCDIDHFKLYNDTYGHQAGDECLKQVAGAINRAVRNNDLVSRYGGEEFAVVLPHTSHEIAMIVAERIVNNVRDLGIRHLGSTNSQYVTLSCGVASIMADGDEPSLDLLLKADRALYKAKANGRDRVVGEYSEL
jgi:adenylate cyclase